MKKKLAKVVNLVYIKEIISGELAERSKATVSKIVILLVGIEGSNPSLSAIFVLKLPQRVPFGTVCLIHILKNR